MTADERKFSYKVVAAATLILLAGWIGMAIMGWDDEVHGQSALVTSYEDYPDTPQAQLTDGCDSSGITGALYSLNGGTPVGSPAALPELDAGDTLTMTWAGTSDACVGSAISIVVKVAVHPYFDPADNQNAYVPYATATADGGPGSLTYTLPGLAGYGHDCAYQLDAIVGLPLAVVGPDGSFYSEALRGDGRRTTLLGARNGAYETCAPPETTTTTTEPTTTTTESTTTSTTPSTTSSTVPASTTVDTTPTCTGFSEGEDQSLSPASAACVLSGGAAVEDRGEGTYSAGALPASTQRQLAATGGTPYGFIIGVCLVGAGLIALSIAKAKRS